MTAKVLLIIVVLFLSGCATPLYNWGGYDDHLYDYYKDPTTADIFLDKMERHLEYIESRQEKPAPGLYAEVGTLYLQKGDQLQAIAFYQKEHDTWPESRHFMEALINNLGKGSFEDE